jgi:hypothetical protein
MGNRHGVVGAVTSLREGIVSYRIVSRSLPYDGAVAFSKASSPQSEI